MRESVLWLICGVVLVVVVLLPVNGQDFFIDEGVEIDEVMAEDEIEGDATEGGDSGPDNMDDVLEGESQCSRYSPKEVFHTVVNPHFFKIFDEMSTFVDASLLLVEEALYTLQPHVDQSPIGRLRIETLFEEMRKFMFGTMKDAYDVLRQAWRDLITIHVRHPSSPTSTLAGLTRVLDTHSQAEKQLLASLQELSVTLKAIIFNSMHVIQTSLNLPNDTNDHESAIAISRSLPQIAPNFLGTVISKILLRGTDPNTYEKANTNLLRSVTPLVEKMHAELKAIVDRKKGTEKEEEKKEKQDAFWEVGREEKDEEEEEMEEYWEAAVKASHAHLKEFPLLEEDFEFYYNNEEYLSELLLQLIATF